MEKPLRNASLLSEGIIREQHSRKKYDFKILPSIVDVWVRFSFWCLLSCTVEIHLPSMENMEIGAC